MSLSKFGFLSFSSGESELDFCLGKDTTEKSFLESLLHVDSLQVIDSFFFIIHYLFFINISTALKMHLFFLTYNFLFA